MITSPEWAAKLDKAYTELYGKKLVLTTKNAGYEWIKRFFQNGLVLGNSDTTISENIGIKGRRPRPCASSCSRRCASTRRRTSPSSRCPR